VRREPGRDRRVAKTDRLLRDALVSLVHEKNYDTIAVREILERANVGRSAFYAHFPNKHALLESGIQHMLKTTPPHRPATPRPLEQVLSFSAAVFQYVGQHRHRHTGETAMARRGRTVLHRRLKQALIKTMTDELRGSSSDSEARAHRIPTGLLVEFIVTTFIVVLDWWVESRSQLSPREVDDLFLSMVLPTLQAAAPIAK
jgi:AcrR family transcriptional regulator